MIVRSCVLSVVKDVDMHIPKAGDQKLAASIDNPRAFRRVNIFTDPGNASALDDDSHPGLDPFCSHIDKADIPDNKSTFFIFFEV